MIVLTSIVQALMVAVTLAALLVGAAVARDTLTTPYPEPED